MPSESDQKMEELLKAYAKKRQDEAGASFELPPGTRRLLQAEVGRRWSRPAAETPSFFQLLVRFWPQIALGCSVVLLLGVVLRLANPTDATKGVPGKVALSRSPAAAPDDLTRKMDADSDRVGARPAEPASTRQPTEAKQTDYAFNLSANSPEGASANGANRRSYSFGLGLTPTNTVPGLQGDKPAPQGGSSASAAPGSDLLAQPGGKLALNLPAGQAGAKEGMNFFKDRALKESETRLRLNDATANPDQTKLTYSLPGQNQNAQKKLELSLGAPAPAGSAAQDLNLAKRAESLGRLQSSTGNQPTTASPDGTQQLRRGDAGKPLAGERVHFSQIGGLQKSNDPQAPAGPTPLSSFEVEQTGDRIRIYDADGSVYEGQIAATGEEAGRLAGASSAGEKAKRQLKVVTDEKIQAGRDLGRLGEQSTQQKMLFQASGTNRTLNQAVVIDGAVISGAVADVKSEPALPVLRPPPESTPPPAPVTPLAQEPASAAGLRGLAPAAPAAAASAPALQAVQERSRYLTAPLLRIQGRAKLGTTKELEIDAVRAPR